MEVVIEIVVESLMMVEAVVKVVEVKVEEVAEKYA